MKDTKIEWCDHTFNPWIGCSKVSPGCQNCYAETLMDKRMGKVQWGPGKPRQRTSVANWKAPLRWNREAATMQRRPRVFCASLADWLDPDVPIEWLADLLDLIRRTPNLDWLLLTKRPELWAKRLYDVLCCAIDRANAAARAEGVATPEQAALANWIAAWRDGVAPANVWMGTTVEDQKRADERIPALIMIPAKKRFLSCEPLLGRVDLTKFVGIGLGFCSACGTPKVKVEPSDYYGSCPNEVCPAWCEDLASVSFRRRIHWVICGGESGPSARPMHPDWARSLRDQSKAAGVAFFFKQWGEWAPVALYECLPDYAFSKGPAFDGVVWRVGKKSAGRMLDGVEHNEFPEVQP